MSGAAAGGGDLDLEEGAGRGEAADGQHRHFGYWIDRDWGRARCYGCGFQFAGTDDTAEDWQPA